MVGRRRLSVGVAVVMLGASAVTLPASSVLAQPARTVVVRIHPPGAECAWPSWLRVHPSAAGDSTSRLLGVAAVSPDDIWAVGYQDRGDVTTLVKHFDGRSWTTVPSPNPKNDGLSVLLSVDAVGARDVWAVGYFLAVDGPERLLIEHWNGTQWRRILGPSLRGQSSGLLGVSAVGRDDVVAVGVQAKPSGNRARSLAMRWDGDAWHISATPSPKRATRILSAVDATSATSSWTVGVTHAAGEGSYKALAEHWNGRTWSQVAVPNPGRGLNQLYSVSVAAPGNVWAAGVFSSGLNSKYGLLLHRSGGHWRQVHIPGLKRGSVLSSVSSDGSDDVWVVGVNGGPSPRALMAHWDGQRWETFGGPGAAVTDPAAVTTHGTTATWAVGDRRVGTHTVPVQEHWTGQVWTR